MTHIASKQVNLNVYIPEYDSKLIEYAKSTSRYWKPIWNQVFQRIKHSMNPSTLQSHIIFYFLFDKLELKSILNPIWTDVVKRIGKRPPKRVSPWPSAVFSSSFDSSPNSLQVVPTKRLEAPSLTWLAASSSIPSEGMQPPGTCNKAPPYTLED